MCIYPDVLQLHDLQKNRSDNSVGKTRQLTNYSGYTCPSRSTLQRQQHEGFPPASCQKNTKMNKVKK